MDVSIIIINYNSSKYTANCLKSIHKFTKSLTYEIIIVDNNSNEDDLKFLETVASQNNSKLIKSKYNLGFGGGNHFGYQHASGDYLAFINNDVELLENSLFNLMTFYKSQSFIGLVGLPQINEEKKVFKYSFRQFIDLKYHLFGQLSPIKHYSKKHHHDLTEPFEVDQVSGAFMFIKASIYESVNGFDPNIFLFYEEMDLCLRLKKKGFKTMFYPNSRFIHFMGKSSANVKLKVEFIISYLYIIQKNYGYWYFCLLRIVLLLKYGFKSIFKPKKYFAPFLIVFKGGNSLVYSMKFNN